MHRAHSDLHPLSRPIPRRGGSRLRTGLAMALAVAGLVTLRLPAAQPDAPLAILADDLSAVEPVPAGKEYLNELVFVKSVFDPSFSSGKDPFFPNTARSQAVAKTNAIVQVTLSDLTLRGISVSANRRMALINRYTLEEGETRSIRTGEHTYEVHCLEVRDRSVVIRCGGQQRELYLRPGL